MGLVLALALALALAVRAPVAMADGDPGSDVLVYQPLFLSSDAGVSVAQQVRLDEILRSADRAGLPIRVAIIASPSDLGAVGQLWGKPRAYARFLGIELSLAYAGRLVIVMPDGLGFEWTGHPTATETRLLSHIPVGPKGSGLARAAEAAVTTLAGSAHASLSGETAAPGPAAGGQGRPQSQPTRAGAGGGTSPLLIAAAVLLAAGLAGALVWRRRSAAGVLGRAGAVVVAGARTVARHLPLRRHAADGAEGLAAAPNPRLRTKALIRPAAAVLVLVALMAGYALLERSAPAPNVALVSNPVLDPGTPLSRTAPDFTLYDQFGQPVSLRAFRGKVVLLAFNDSECTTLCPLTTSAMLAAKAMLGSAGDGVQLLGVDANPKATAIEDIATYSQLHGMLHAWHFLTGSLPALRRVWSAYSVGVQIDQRLVDHTPAIFVIDPHGRLVKLFLTQQSYAAVDQLGQLLAGEASQLLPGHPAVHSHLSYNQIPGITPADAASVPDAYGGRVELAPGRARLLLFFASWDRQITGLPSGLEGLSRYGAIARRAGLPQLTAVDEGAVEPPGALAGLLRSLPHRLSYPVAVDTTGRLADGYEVQGQPWLMVTSATGQIAWYYSVAGLGWPTTSHLVSQVRAALAHVPSAGSTVAAGSPPALASLHHQAGSLLGSPSGLTNRIRSLRGYPIVVNVWASWCGPCREEFGLFADASARYGNRVAFLGANYEDSSGDARAFLSQHHVSYPSYVGNASSLGSLAAIEGLPTTVYINRSGKVVFVHTGQYDSQGSLDGDVQTYAAAGQG